MNPLKKIYDWFHKSDCAKHPNAFRITYLGCETCYREAFIAAREAERQERIAIVEEGMYRAAKRLHGEGL